MHTQQKPAESKSGSAEWPSRSPPTISLPKGGGAIRGIGEKFGANPVTGTGSMTVPIAISSGRSGFGPQLSLSYDSGAGNGPFGFGWSLSLPSIARKTDKGLPRYRDADESDVFILSGAEDLVPVLVETTGGNWEREQITPRTVEGKIYRIQRYRPRIEGLFARIERWTNQIDPTETFWRSISRENITTWYGKTPESRVGDPADPTRIFSWLICESYDDKGNIISYRYKEENSDDLDLSQAHEGNRSPETRAANRYLKRIRYGNHAPYFPQLTETSPWPALPADAAWYFEVVLDYGEHDADTPSSTTEVTLWPRRNDPFSTYRAGFEVRTYRLCQRVLMFHHFPGEASVEADCLVRSTDFTYSYEENPTDARNPIFSTLLSVTQSGYKRQGSGYLKKSLPPLEFEYTKPTIDDTIRDVDVDSLENLPAGLDGRDYQWIDLEGEGVSGILTEQAEGWFYKRNLSPVNLVKQNGDVRVLAKFAPAELVATKPNATIADGSAQFMDLAGDGQPDLVLLDSPILGFYEHDDGPSWNTFRPFTARLNRSTTDPNLRFVDLDGDGHADVLITEDEAFTWHPSLAEEGFGPAERLSKPRDEEQGPTLVFADGTQSIYLADMSGDGLTDLVRIRNGEVCYWPNLGYGHFGAKVSMDNAPWFDAPELFDQRRVHLADIDGSGVTDILYLHGDGVRLYFNQSGNSWSQPGTVPAFPRIDNLAAVTAVDLLGNGTACLVWSSPSPGHARRPMRYIDLMGGQKPHLLVRVVNNLGAETRVHYASSTKFYLRDKLEGNPWITRLPFPVHVVERVETHDLISRNRFVSRHAYHHGYFDGEEREFRGFGMVEQWDTEELGALKEGGTLPEASNIDESSYVPPVHTKTWFHTGVYDEIDEVSQHFAGEYYGAPESGDPNYAAKFAAFLKTLLPDTVLPPGLALDAEREASRALKGSMLRQEIYALDSSAKAKHPYTVTEQNFTIQTLQPRGANRYAVFFSHSRKALSYHYERNPDDPRIGHAITLETDKYGNVLKSVDIGYGRKQSPLPEQSDREKQTKTLIVYIENSVTNAIDDNAPDDYRTPLPAEALTYELTGYSPASSAVRFQISDLVQPDPADPDGRRQIHIFDSELNYEQSPTTGRQRRVIEHVRTLYRSNDLTSLLPLGQLESLALPGESYKLAFTSELFTNVFQRNGQALLPNPRAVLRGQGADRGGYVDLDADGHWWIPSGKILFDVNADVTNPANTAAQELTEARVHFFLPRKFVDPFNQSATVDYDMPRDLLVVSTEDAVGNRVAAQNNYRVLAPRLITDPNGNRSEVAFDALGLVAGTAVMGKALPAPVEGDSLNDFQADLPQGQIDAFHGAHDPHVPAPGLLKDATTRIIYDLNRFKRLGEPPFAATLSRETHVSDPLLAGGLKIQISFSYSDGFGREIQKKIQAEPGPLVEGGPIVSPRWAGSGWTVFNNKGKPVRQYEPFFSQLLQKRHHFEFGVAIGVSPVLFYDPVDRVVATLHPNHTWEKVVFNPWEQKSYDVNDTVLNTDGSTDPKLDGDVKEFFSRLPTEQYLPTWYEERIALAANDPERVAAEKTAVHRQTPTKAHFDTLGRTFLTITQNRFKRNHAIVEEKYPTRVELDIEGNQRSVRDAVVQNGDVLGRVVMRYDYDMLGNRIHQASMEAGERWMLNDVTGKLLYAWDSRGHQFKTEYDQLRRSLRQFVQGTDATHSDPRTLNRDVLFARTEYGEGQTNDTALNLRTRVFKHFDSAGVVTNMGRNPLTTKDEAYDFKGNVLRSSRGLADDYHKLYDWQTDTAQPTWETFSSCSTYDALNRPTSVTTPDHSLYLPTFNEANLLEKVDVNLRGAATPTPFVTDIDYNAKGQRVLIEYGILDASQNSKVKTEYEYDEETFRLRKLSTTRRGFPQDERVLQDLHYTYDPAGNITEIRDGAQQTIYFSNQVVTPDNDYIYDAIYRLIEAKGREHIGQVSQPETTWDDEFRVSLQHPQNGQAMRGYTERYEYDPVGNFERVIHIATNGWTRSYAYDVPSLIEPTKKNNGLSGTTVGNATPEVYPYDAHGNMTAMPHLPHMSWDFRDQLQQVDLAGGGDAYYVYDSAGQRVRKVVEKNGGALIDERIYFGGFEIFRRRNGTGAVTLERETLHIMDDKQRIALVETRTHGNDGSPAQLVRYQLSNHLGSASVELDDTGRIISYEEYYPYGSTSYQVGRNAAEVSLKRYRYTGKERDEETGFAYHGARYFAPWLAIWVSCDPRSFDQVTQALNSSYAAFALNPVQYVDTDGAEPKKPPNTEPVRSPGSPWERFKSNARQISFVSSFFFDDPNTKALPSPVEPQGDEAPRDKKAEAESTIDEDTRGNQAKKSSSPPPEAGGTRRKGFVIKGGSSEPITFSQNFLTLNETQKGTRLLTVDDLYANTNLGNAPKVETIKPGGGGGGLPVQANRVSPARPQVGSSGAAMGGIQVVAGGFNVYAGTQQEDTHLEIAGIGGGTLQIAGGATWILGAARESAPLISAGRNACFVGAVLTAPVTASNAYKDMQSGDEYRRFRGALNMVSIAVPPVGFVSAYNEVFVKPAAKTAAEVVRRDLGTMMQRAQGLGGQQGWFRYLLP